MPGSALLPGSGTSFPGALCWRSSSPAFLRISCCPLVPIMILWTVSRAAPAETTNAVRCSRLVKTAGSRRKRLAQTENWPIPGRLDIPQRTLCTKSFPAKPPLITRKVGSRICFFLTAVLPLHQSQPESPAVPLP